MKLHLDFETRSAVDLKKVGAWRYALDPSTEVMCMGVWVGGQFPEPIIISREKVRVPNALELAFKSDRVISAHNVSFEYSIYNLILHRRYGWPERWDPARWSCTMSRSAMCGLPLDLDSLSRVLGCKTPKDLDGRRIMHRLCKPIDTDPLGDPIYDEDPAKYARLYEYNANDVKTEMEVDALLPELPASERAVWELDLTMNRRGIKVDVDFARRAAALSDKIVRHLDTQLTSLTNGEVDKATRVAAIKEHLKKRYGIVADSLDQEAVTSILENPLTPPAARDILFLRRQVAKKNSVAKYAAALSYASPTDGRARGLLQYHAAHTGRWGGRGLQPQNFPKGWDTGEEQTEAITAIMGARNGEFSARYGVKSMDALSNSLRGLFVASPEKELVCADFNAIEARVLFWLASEENALAAYRRGESPYLEMGKAIYHRFITKKDDPQEYDIAKRTILGAGYGMGAKKFRSNIYTETAKKGRGLLVSEELAERAIKVYRTRYPLVPNLWRATERAAIDAVLNPTQVFSCAAGGKVAWGMTKDRRFLACRLPSGRFLRYWKPSVESAWVTFCQDDDCVHWKKMDDNACPKRQKRWQLCYQGENAYSKQWGTLTTYGGALVENVTQAVARDLLVGGMQRVSAAGYDLLLTIHDEVLAEKAAPNLVEFIALLCEPQKWATGLPIAAEGWVGQRYRK